MQTNFLINDFFKLSSTLKIYKPQVNLNVRKFIFTVRIIDVWKMEIVYQYH